MIGLSMRELPYSPAAGQVDIHDALSHHWGRFCAQVGLRWIPLPNGGEETLDLVTHLDLAGVILTGGGDVGTQPQRDATEHLLLTWAQETGRPLLGVCRGFQFIQCALGGQLVECAAQKHVAHQHAITWTSAHRAVPAQSTSMVNSFHNWGIRQLAPPLQPLAICEADSTIEAAYADNIVGLMWHPERDAAPSALNIHVVRSVFC